MNIVPWDPIDEMERLRARTEALWDEFFAKLTGEQPGQLEIGFLPDADLVETQEDFRVYLAIPGLVEEDIEIEAEPQRLTIRGERQPPYDPHRKHTREWRYGFFERQLTLRRAIVVEAVTADYEAGVLTVILPKAD